MKDINYMVKKIGFNKDEIGNSKFYYNSKDEYYELNDNDDILISKRSQYYRHCRDTKSGGQCGIAVDYSFLEKDD